MKLINLGFDNVVAKDRVVAVVGCDAAPIKRLREQARKNHKLIDVTNGRKTRAVVITDSDHVILSSVQPKTIVDRAKEA